MSRLNKIVAQTYPPLGQATVLCDSHTSLKAVLEVPSSTARDYWQVALWYSIDGAAWTEISLTPCKAEIEPQALCPVSESTTTILCFATSVIQFAHSLQFTLKFRLNSEESWRWIRDEQGLDDGYVMLRPPPAAYKSLLDIVQDLDSAWQVSSRLSQSPGTQLWSLRTRVPPANGDRPSYQNVAIGAPWTSFLKWFALVQTSVAWLAPRHGKTELYLDKDAVLLSLLSRQGQTMTILAVCNNNVLPLLRHTDGGGGVSVHVQNDSTTEEEVTILISVGNTFENTVASVMYDARGLVEKAQAANVESTQRHLSVLSSVLQPDSVEPWYDGLGFCTWNALGQRLTEQKILDTLDELKRRDISITNLIIDDNWQSIDYHGHTQFQHGWVDFDAESASFPDGLKGAVSKIKERYPNIQNVSVWHAIIGYWGGISPQGKIAQSYKTIPVIRKEGENPDMALGDKITLVAKDDVLRLYQDFYQFLAKAGIDGVKVDAQYMLGMLRDASDRRDLINQYFDAWNQASKRHFGFQTISCMSLIPQSIFHALLPRSSRQFQLRNSDDFFPHVPSSHPWHVWTNAHNAIFTQYLNVVPDWDMFQTGMDYSAFHAAARCVSGGPIYITDVPGEHDMNLISQITARTIRGNTIVLRPKFSGKALHSYAGYEDNLLLKVGTYNGEKGVGTSIVTIFNISRQSLIDLIPLSIFPGFVETQQYVIRAHNTGRVSTPIKLGMPDALITAPICAGGYEIFCGFPAVSFSANPSPRNSIMGEEAKKVCVSNLGLINKMTGGVAIESSMIMQRAGQSIAIVTELRALGILGVYISTLKNLTVRTDFMVLINDRVIPEKTISVSKHDDRVLEVDIEEAWKGMKLEPGYGDKFKVEIVFSW